MKKHLLMLTTAASILACGTAGASIKKIPTTRSCSSWNKRNRTRPMRLTPAPQTTA